ncbi:polysaccharide biosynthesis protein [Dactylosporangium sp. NPDC005555]|uniref:polysaccharide biosynthesis protein n=1 Tax=Dactylosporangium sp. NPDC005555 TaxID=3154889 RepID=UPI0033AF97B9
MSAATSGRRFLITGGTGSFGQAMVARLLASDVEEVRVLSRDETKQSVMRDRFNDPRLRCHLGDIRDPDSVLLASRGVDYAYHAAALKQVPSCEFFPLEAVRTNVLGSANLVEACERNGVRTVVLLSTDKAVRPVNAMGMSKAIMEKLSRAHGRGSRDAGTVVTIVRYGNVMYSRGSVIPLFIEQIKTGRPLTVTDPRMTRFLMSIEESVGLVEHAFTHGRPGDLFVRKAGAATIGDLAEAVANLFGAPVATAVIGARHGERQHETLATAEELAHAEDHGEYYRIPVDGRDLNYVLHQSNGHGHTNGHALNGAPSDYDSSNARRFTVAELETLLMSLPEIRAELAMSRALIGVA